MMSGASSSNVSSAAAAAAAPAAPAPSSDLLAVGEGADSAAAKPEKESIVLKCSLLGDSGVGKTSLMVRYCERRFSETYMETVGVSFLEREIATPTANVVMSLFDLGGDMKAFSSLLPVVCCDAAAMIFCFDLTNRSSLSNIKDWFRQARGLNSTAIPILVGTKFDLMYSSMDALEQQEVVTQARKYAKAMKAPLIFCSSSHGINVLKLFKLIFCLAFGLPADVEKITEIGQPLLEY